MAMNLKTAKKPAAKPAPKVAITAPPQELQNAVAEIVTTHKDGSQTSETEEVATASGKGPFANVGVRASRTFNLGDYQSLKVEISLNVPCPVEVGEIEETYTFATGWVDGKMNEKNAEIEAALAAGSETA